MKWKNEKKVIYFKKEKKWKKKFKMTLPRIELGMADCSLMA